MSLYMPLERAMVRRSNSFFPLVFFGIWGVAQIAVFWFDYFRILPISSLLIYFLMIFIHSGNKHGIIANYTLFGAFFAIYPVILLSTFWSPSPQEALESAARTIATAVPIFFAAEWLGRYYRLERIVQSLILIPIIFLAQAIYNFVFYDDPAIYGELSIRTVAGSMLSILGPLFFGAFLLRRSWWYLLGSILCFGLALILESRTGLLLNIIGVMVVWAYYDLRWALRVATFATPIALLVLLGSDFPLLERFAAAGTSFDVGSDVLAEFAIDRTQRVDFDRRLHTFLATEMLLSNPVIGGGYGALLFDSKFFFGVDLPAHGYIGSFAEIGMLGVLAFVTFLTALYRSYRRRWRYLRKFGNHDQLDVMLILAFVMALGVGLFHQVFESPYYAVFAGLVVGRLARIEGGRNVSS